MPKYQKYVNALFIAAGAIVWFISSYYTTFVIGYFQLGRKLGGGADVIQHAVPFLIGAGTFAALRRSPLTFNFTMDSVGELIKVSWPSAKETRLGTIVVIVTVILAGLALGLLDLGFTALIRTIIGA